MKDIERCQGERLVQIKFVSEYSMLVEVKGGVCDMSENHPKNKPFLGNLHSTIALMSNQ